MRTPPGRPAVQRVDHADEGTLRRMRAAILEGVRVGDFERRFRVPYTSAKRRLGLADFHFQGERPTG